MEAVQEHLDLAGFINYWAVGMYVGQFDSYPYSNPGDDCHVYNNPETGTLVFIPHGEDETFYYDTSSVAQANGIVGQRCLNSSTCFSDLKQRVREVIDIANDIDMLGIFDEVQALIDPYVRADTHRPYSLEYVEYYQDHMRKMIRQRESELEDQLDL
jgi:spore coat protein CotH